MTSSANTSGYSWCYTNCCNCIYNDIVGQGDPEYGICNVIDTAISAFNSCSAKYGDCGEDLTDFNSQLSTWCTTSTTVTPSTSKASSTTVIVVTTTSSSSKASTTSSNTPVSVPTNTSSSQSAPPTTSTKPSSTTTSSSKSTPTTSSQPSSTSTTSASSSVSYITIPTQTSASTSSTTSESSIPISYATPSYSAISTTSSTSTHTPLPQYTGSGDLLVGYCTTPYFTVIPGPTADFYIGVIGCVNGKDDCCPFAATSTHAPTASAAATSTGPSFTTITVGGTSSTSSTTSGNGLNTIGENQAFPTPDSPSAGELDHCPGDYQTISNSCCPSNYLLFSTDLGGQTPCYSTITPYLTPPPLPSPTATTSTHPTSAVVNVVYAMAYPVKSSTSSGMPTATKAGIGGGVGALALLVLVSIGAFFFRKHAQKKTGKHFIRRHLGNSRVSEMYQSPPPAGHAQPATGYPPPLNPAYAPGVFDRDQGRRYNNNNNNSTSPIERGMSVSPPESYPSQNSTGGAVYNYPPPSQQQGYGNQQQQGSYFPPNQQRYGNQPPPMNQYPARAQTIQRVPVPAPVIARPQSQSPESFQQQRVLTTVPPQGLHAPPSPPPELVGGSGVRGGYGGNGELGYSSGGGEFSPVEFGLLPENWMVLL
ncbi:hypothetical protein G7Y89_g4025 [Cudoniella acicularis]|uniref:Uncharacterized protein n=1 Tax=Cudoniella acicularis TaxID=354080 RepID=A0A8H4RQ92_9HELO|nr:hypothetical protein G7Y89_g4025 [Cudoniella acicularis]